MEERQSQTEYFRSILLAVVGQAFDAAGYTLENRPIQWAGGHFRFKKSLDNGLSAYIEFQLLVYTDSFWSAGQESRFRVNLIRTDQVPTKPSSHPQYANRTLSALVVEDFGVAIIESSDYWWGFRDTTSLGNALAEAGHLIVGYAMPWLAGDLIPPNSQASG